MSKTQKALIGLGIVGAVGITYALAVLNALPEAFEWEDYE
jgi:hypothetical protein